MTGGPTVRRRTLLRAGMGAALLPLAAGCDTPWPPRPVLLRSNVPAPPRFTVAMPLPPALRPTPGPNGVDVVELSAKPGTVELLPGRPCHIWGYEGRFPGPTVRVQRGRPVVLRLRNELPAPVVTHLHGGHTPARSDGYPTDLVLPVGGSAMPHHHDPLAVVTTGSREYRYPNDQPAATLWYHDHRMDATAAQVWQGLFGTYVIEDADHTLGLPAGDRDVPLVLCDRSFGDGGLLPYPAGAGGIGTQDRFAGGVLGDVILVNGAPWPEMRVAPARYRFRLVNASNARRYLLRLNPGGDLVQIGGDAGLLTAPVRHPSLPISPGERYDVIIDFAAYPRGATVLLTDAGSGDVLRWRVSGPTGTDPSRIPVHLGGGPPAAGPSRGRQVLRFARRHGRWTINGLPFDPSRSDVVARLGQTQLWTVTADVRHPFHVHGTAFRVVHRVGGLRPTDSGWKDTVEIGAAQAVTMAVRFQSGSGRYLAHCHNLEHEDMSMMANIEVN